MTPSPGFAYQHMRALFIGRCVHFVGVLVERIQARLYVPYPAVLSMGHCVSHFHGIMYNADTMHCPSPEADGQSYHGAQAPRGTLGGLCVKSFSHPRRPREQAEPSSRRDGGSACAEGSPKGRSTSATTWWPPAPVIVSIPSPLKNPVTSRHLRVWYRHRYRSRTYHKDTPPGRPPRGCTILRPVMGNQKKTRASIASLMGNQKKSRANQCDAIFIHQVDRTKVHSPTEVECTRFPPFCSWAGAV